MPITAISRDWANNPSLVRMITSDDYATITAAGYLADQQARIEAINYGSFAWVAEDTVLVFYASNQRALFYRDATTDSLVPVYSSSASGTVMNVTVFDSAITTTFIPEPTTKYLMVEMVGAGAGSYSLTPVSTGEMCLSSNGGNGAYLSVFVSDFAPGYEFGISVGVGGDASSLDQGTPPGDGTATAFGVTDLSIQATATGGTAGNSTGSVDNTTGWVIPNGDFGTVSGFSPAPGDFVASIIKETNTPYNPGACAWYPNDAFTALISPSVQSFSPPSGQGGVGSFQAELGSAQPGNAGTDGSIIIYEFS